MIQGNASLIIDLGNSETRVMTIFGTTQSGAPRQRLSILSNKFGELSSKDARLLNNPDYDETNSKVMILEDGSMFCSGSMCDREKGTLAIRPSASLKKYDSEISMYSVRLAFLQGFNHIADMLNCRISDIDVNWTVTVLLPPSDLELGADKMRNRIMELGGIRFAIPQFDSALRIDNVRVMPEGFCAFIGVAFENARKLREGYETILSQSTLVIDIGAGTSDLCIIKEAKLVDGSRHSEEIGGNQVFQKLNNDLRKALGLNIPEEELRRGAISGEIKIGAIVKDVTEELTIARKDVATRISSAIRNYIESSDFSALSIENILICGGGAELGVKGVKPLGEYLQDDLREWMKYSKFLENPTVNKIIEKDGIDYKKTETISPRLLNVIGAGVLAQN